MIKNVTRKQLIIKFSGRSSDYITPSFGHGCLLDCSYCYMKRNKPEGLTIAQNVGEILTKVNNHSMFCDIEKPNQTDDKYITYDISCNEDFALHLKYHNWKYIFDFFKNHPIAKGTFATKIIPNKLLDYNSNKKIRIRFSLMPQKLSSVLEPNTPLIIDRIKAINTFIEANYEVHINFSPVILYKNWENDYKNLFLLVDNIVKNEYKKEVKCEVIFLTHNENKHQYNLQNNVKGEKLLWIPNIQESKISQYGGANVRYNYKLKSRMINKFILLHNKIIEWNTIRYIF
jgi:spore photoproduct lyase